MWLTAPVAGGCEHDPADAFGVADGHLKRDQGAETETEQVGAVDAEMIDEADGVSGQVLDGQFAVDVHRTSVPLEFRGDHAPTFGEGRQGRPETRLDRLHAPMRG